MAGKKKKRQASQSSHQGEKEQGLTEDENSDVKEETNLRARKLEVSIEEDIQLKNVQITPYESSGMTLDDWLKMFMNKLVIAGLNHNCVIVGDESFHSQVLGINYTRIQNIKSKLRSPSFDLGNVEVPGNIGRIYSDLLGDNSPLSRSDIYSKEIQTPWQYVRNVYRHLSEEKFSSFFPLYAARNQDDDLPARKIESYMRAMYKNYYISRYGVDYIWDHLPLKLKQENSKPTYIREMMEIIDRFKKDNSNPDYMNKFTDVLTRKGWKNHEKSLEGLRAKVTEITDEFLALYNTYEKNPYGPFNYMRHQLLNFIQDEATEHGLDFTKYYDTLKFDDNFDPKNRITTDIIRGPKAKLDSLITEKLKDRSSTEKGTKVINKKNKQNISTKDQSDDKRTGRLINALHKGEILPKGDAIYVRNLREAVTKKYKEAYPTSNLPPILNPMRYNKYNANSENQEINEKDKENKNKNNNKDSNENENTNDKDEDNSYSKNLEKEALRTLKDISEYDKSNKRKHEPTKYVKENENPETEESRYCNYSKEWIQENRHLINFNYQTEVNDMPLSKNVSVPYTLNQAMQTKLKEEWSDAIQDVLKSLRDNGTWTPLTNEEVKQYNQKPIKSRFVFALKTDTRGYVDRFKARLVAKGFTQIEGIDYDQTYPPVVTIEHVRITLAIATINDLHIHHVDIKTAFLNSQIDKTILFQLPKGFGDDVVVLNKAIYGLKQALKRWYDELGQTLINLKFDRLVNDECFYIKYFGEKLLVVAIYVDDILILSKDQRIIEQFKEDLKAYYALTDYGQVTKFLGLGIYQDIENKKLTVNSSEYVDSHTTSRRHKFSL